MAFQWAARFESA